MGQTLTAEEKATYYGPFVWAPGVVRMELSLKPLHFADQHPNPGIFPELTRDSWATLIKELNNFLTEKCSHIQDLAEGQVPRQFYSDRYNNRRLDLMIGQIRCFLDENMIVHLMRAQGISFEIVETSYIESRSEVSWQERLILLQIQRSSRPNQQNGSNAEITPK